MVVGGGRRVLLMVILERGVRLVEARDDSDAMRTRAIIECMLRICGCVQMLR